MRSTERSSRHQGVGSGAGADTMVARMSAAPATTATGTYRDQSGGDGRGDAAGEGIVEGVGLYAGASDMFRPWLMSWHKLKGRD